MIWKNTIPWAALTDSKSGVTQQGPYQQPWCQSSRSLTPNQDAVFQLAPPREPGAGTKKWLLVPVTCLVLSCDSGGGWHHQTAWSLQSCRGSSLKAGLLIQSRGDENSSVYAPFLPTGSILEMVSGRHDPKRNMLLSLFPSFLLRPFSAPGGLLSSSLPHPFQMAVVFPQKSGTTGRCLYSASLPSSDLSSISLGFFPSLPPSVCPSLYLGLPAGAPHTHTHARARTRAHTRVSTHSLEPSLLSVANTLAHRHKHTLRQSKSKNKRGEGEQRETEGEKESRSGRREGLDVDTMRKHKGFHIFPDWPASHLECDLSLV